MHWNDYFFIEGNECIYSDYVIDVKISDFPIKDNARLHVYDLLKVYYKFLEEFTSTDYIDYINYAVEIEKME